MASLAVLLIVWLPPSIKLPVGLLVALGGVCYVWACNCGSKGHAAQRSCDGRKGRAMRITNVGIASIPAESPFEFDFSDNQTWWHGLSIECERCDFSTVLLPGSAGFMAGDVACGLMSAFHVTSKDKSRPGWGQGVFVCPTPNCNSFIRFRRTLMPDGSIPAEPEIDAVETVDASQHWFD